MEDDLPLGDKYKRDMVKSLGDVRIILSTIINDDNYQNDLRLNLRGIRADISNIQDRIRNKNIVHLSREEMMKYKKLRQFRV